MTSYKNCVLIDKLTREANYGANPRVSEINNPENAIYQITDTKLYIPVVTLSKTDRTMKWNKYRSQMTIQRQNNNLNYLIVPTFMNVNRLFVLTFPTNNNTNSRYSFSNDYVPKVKINDLNVLIDRISFFDLPVKNEEEAYEKIIDMSNVFAYFKKHYKLIAIHLSKQTNLKDLQQINFIGGKLLKNTGATMFFIIEKSEETIFNFSKNSVTII